MVSIIGSNKNAKIASVELDINNILDIINGLNILVAEKEEEMRKMGSELVDDIDRKQYQRYKNLLTEFQTIKGLYK